MARANASTVPGLVAHRGAPTRYPENSLAGYKAVLNMAMLHPDLKTFIEVDVRTTRDGVAIALHDKRVDRTLDGHGVCYKHDWKDLGNLHCKPITHPQNDGPLDFEQLRHDLKSEAPVWEIEPATTKNPGDYRIPTIEELLELTRLTNKYLMKVGHPVGICLDLKAREILPSLAKTLKHFSADHANAVLPMIGLGIETKVSKGDMKRFWKDLSHAAQRYFYETPELVSEVIHQANLHANTGPGFSRRVASALSSALCNLVTPWRLIGNHEMLGKANMQVAGNHHCLTSMDDVRAAAGRQDLIWVDRVWDAMLTLDELQKSGKLPPASRILSAASKGILEESSVPTRRSTPFPGS
jgi:glycerophosphoryl diester phosphodiesterase